MNPKEIIERCNNMIKRLEHAAYGEQNPEAIKDIEALDEVISVLEKQEQERWVSCSDRMPEEETDVLICNANGDIAICRGSMSTESPGSWMWYMSGWIFSEATAWRPLPEPYTEEES